MTTIIVFGGGWLILGDRISGPHRWWGALIGSLAALGLLELLIAMRVLRSGWNWRGAGRAAAGTALLLAAILLTDSWRWVAAGAWPVVVVSVLFAVWPPPEDTAAG